MATHCWTKCSVLVPYRSDGGHRDRLWGWILRRWELLVPEAEVILSEAPPGAHPGEFNHPWAINRAAEMASHDVFIVADADTAFDPGFIHRAVAMVADEQAPWVLPRFYDQLDEPSTRQIIGSDPAGPIGDYSVGWRGDSVSWSGLVVVPRAGFEEVGGYDERWEYWGGDDVAFACSMNTLWGPVERIEGAAMHLWHERNGLDAQPRNQHDLMHAYLAADGDPEAIRAVQRS